MMLLAFVVAGPLTNALGAAARLRDRGRRRVIVAALLAALLLPRERGAGMTGAPRLDARRARRRRARPATAARSRARSRSSRTATRSRYQLVADLYPHTGHALRGRDHRAARRRQVDADLRAGPAGPRARADGRRGLGRPVEPVHPGRAARRPHPPGRPLPRPRGLHPLDGHARPPRRPRRDDAAGAARARRRRARTSSSSRRSAPGRARSACSSIADTVVLVLMPGSGDSIQALKAGIMEIPDVIAINKSDHPLAKTMLNEVRQVLALGPHDGRAAADRPDRGAARGRDRRRSGRRSREHRAWLEADGRARARRRSENLAREVFAGRRGAGAAASGGGGARRPAAARGCSTRSSAASSTR